MAGSSPVAERLRAVLAESRLSGLPVPDEATWIRRLPAHAEEVRRVFASWRDAECGGHTEPDPAPQKPLESRPIWAEAPDPVELLAEGAHGRLVRSQDGLRYVLPAARLEGRNPATEYLLRARRLEAAGVAGVQTPRVEQGADGDVLVNFRSSAGAPVVFGVTASRRRGATRRALEVMGRVAARIRLLHQRDAAHGRLSGRSLLLDPGTRRLVVATGLEDGPGLDEGSLERQQTADLRALGALLFGALSLEGTEPDVKEILARHDANELPSLAVRRPDLSPALVRLVERALAAGGPNGFSTASELLAALDRICDHETDAEPRVTAVRIRPRVAVAAAALVLGGLLLTCHLVGGSEDPGTGHLDVRDGQDLRIERVRELLDAGREREARRMWQDLEDQIGISRPSGG